MNIRITHDKNTPLSDKLLELGVYVFSVWTFSSHIATYLRLNLYHLMAIFAVGCLGFGYLYLKKFRVIDAPSFAEPEDETAPLRVAPWSCLLFVALALAILLHFFHTRNSHVFWGESVALLGLALLLCRKDLFSAQALAHPKISPPASQMDRPAWIALWLLAALFAAITLVAHRVEVDDVNYHSTAAYIADNPSEPLFSKDPKHAAENLPYLFLPHKAESLLILPSAVRVLTGMNVTVFFHFVLAGLAGFLCVFAHAKLLRILTPKHWFFALVAVEIIYLAMGETHRGWGLYAYTRLHEGKSIFVTLLMPLTIAYALELAETFSWPRLLRFVGVQIASVGMTSTALWAAPCVGLLGLAAGAPGLRALPATLKRIAIASTAFIYPFLIGLIVMVETKNSPFRDYLMSREAIAVHYPDTSVDYLDMVFILVMKWTPLAFFALFALIAGWLYAPNQRARRFCLIYAALFLGGVLNPFLVDLVIRITCPLHYWRLMWMLPLPFFMALVLTSPVTLPRSWKWLLSTAGLFGVAVLASKSFEPSFLASLTAKREELLASRHAVVVATVFAASMLGCFWVARRGRSASGAALGLFAAALLLFYVLLPSQYVLSNKSNTEIKKPSLKVHPGPYAVASWMAKRAGVQDLVIAPQDVSLWLVTFEHHPSPLFTIKYWDYLLEIILSKEEVERRNRLRLYVSGQATSTGAETATSGFMRDMAAYNLALVCFWKDMPYASEAQSALAKAGYKLEYQDHGFEVWVRSIKAPS